MKKTYYPPVCQLILVEDLDILTISLTSLNDGEGGFDDGAVIQW